ncbi:bifunctional folylpolyglutamate synthase/dihydrofolate synthase [Kiloniella sp. b19]|uniref:bifunctional folylpolyglutamate synthase/dihydrofolate synthase n=1 Tax=Kiloniella sp. GXU_MW_B19 TaxID=3141326 RepID=UPI0031DA460D
MSTESPSAVSSETLRKERRSDVVLDRLSLLHPKIIDLSLGRTLNLLEKLGRPQDRLPPVIHVAGTNGKGSLLAYLRAMLEASGRKLHVYTSPHLVKFHERICLAGELITEDALVELLEECEEVNGNEGITFFEITTVAGIYAFAGTPADALLLETGLGGELDSTNVVDQPALTAITPISIDHTQYLGETMEEIAKAKAGIIKQGVPCVVGKQPEAALRVIRARAAELDAPLYIAGEDWSSEVLPDGSGFVFRGRNGEMDCPAPNLLGEHQFDNAALAFACAEILASEQTHQPLVMSVEERHKGITTARWPGRMQQLSGGELPDRLKATGDAQWELWLDGGHNASAGEALGRILDGWSDRPVHIVYGMLNTKAATDYLRPLTAKASSLRALRIPGEAASLSAEEAADHAREAGFEAKAVESAEAAIEDILANEKPGRIIICGSLYLAGHILSRSH